VIGGIVLVRVDELRPPTPESLPAPPRTVLAADPV
jgi:hypothetical protein